MAVTHLQPESSCGSYMVVTGGLHGGYTPAAREQLRQLHGGYRVVTWRLHTCSPRAAAAARRPQRLPHRPWPHEPYLRVKGSTAQRPSRPWSQPRSTRKRAPPRRTCRWQRAHRPPSSPSPSRSDRLASSDGRPPPRYCRRDRPEPPSRWRLLQLWSPRPLLRARPRTRCRAGGRTAA